MKKILACACGLLAASAAFAADFSFSGIKVHKLDFATINLRLGDVNGDGKTDVVVANNARARIECLLQATEKLKPEATTDAEVNVLADDALFVSRPLLVDKKIFSMELGDLNGDGRTDVAYYGDPRALVVAFQNAEGEWGARRAFDIADGATNPAALAIGDLNGDGKSDLVLLATDGIYFIYQNKDGLLEAPVKESGLPEGAFGVAIRDFNADKRGDLLYACANDIAPICLRLQGENGRLGPEIRCKAPMIRGLGLGDIDGDGAEDPIAIQQASGRMVIYKLETQEAATSLLDGPYERYAFSATGARRSRAMTFGALADAKRTDILVSDPDGAEVELFVQGRAGAWHRSASFPAYQGITDLALADVDANGSQDVLMLSPDESALGFALLDANGRLGFPKALPVAGKPLCIAAADVDGDGKLEILYCSVKDQERAIYILGAGAFEQKGKIVVTGARTDPDGLLVADANQDGRLDLLLFTPFQEMRIFKGTETGFVDVSAGGDYGKSLVQGVKLKSMTMADITGDGKPEMLVATKNFVRALRLDEKDRLVVVEQLNGRSQNSVIAGVGAADFDDDKTPEVALVDSSNRCLSLLKRDKMGLYEIVENLPIGAVNMDRFVVGDLTGNGKPDLLLMEPNNFSVAQPGMPVVALREVASYETPVRNGRIDNVSLGDLDGDGQIELLAIEGTRNALELLTWDRKEKRLTRALSWPVFESKSFPGSRMAAGAAGSEPREVEIADVTGDGKADIILLVHDRVIVYPRE